MSYKDHRLGRVLLGVDMCPHCSVANPQLICQWAAERPIDRADAQPANRWGVFACTTCGGIVSARGNPGENVNNPMVDEIFPSIWQPDACIPQTVSNYLRQAKNTLGSPDASVLMSNAAIDAMLKDNGLEQGNLHERIGQAVTNGLLTNAMANWAHSVRLDANNPRHADAARPHLTAQDATRAFDFAEALIELVYVLPSRMPQDDQRPVAADN